MDKVTNHDVMLTWVSLVHAGTHLPAELSDHLQEQVGISLAEQDLMSQLAKAGGQLKMVDLARIIFISKAGVTKMVRRIEQAGLIERSRSESDRRVIYTQLTKKGERILARSRELLLAWVQTNFGSNLSADQLLQLQSALKCVLSAHGRWEGQMKHLQGLPHED